MERAHNETFHERTVKQCKEFYNISKRNRYRLCTVDGKEALFHKWTEEREIVAPSLMRGGHQGGTIATTLGMVEYLDGRVARVTPERIQFLDTKDHKPDKRKRK